jgi:hypothetical protein
VKQDDIRQWYEAHGMEYVAEDWGSRSDTGESTGRAPDVRERPHSGRVASYDGKAFEQMEDLGLVGFLWTQREDHDTLDALEEFFTPYLATMPHAKRRLIDGYIYNRRSQARLAETLGVSQQAVSKRLAAALRWLVKTIADEQRFLAEVAGDYETMSAEDEELAWHSFNTFWEGRFGTPWPLRG